MPSGTFMPAYLLLLSGGSDLAVGIALSLQAAGMMITPLIGANMIGHRARVLPVGFITGGAMRAMVLCIGLSGLFLDRARRWSPSCCSSPCSVCSRACKA
ncbi:MAG: hypothetical protein HC809_11150 [Gammaproteobacteria bacterium]|nr:hypothetical protein [Gammaproteobacteria bacterium]